MNLHAEELKQLSVMPWGERVHGFYGPMQYEYLLLDLNEKLLDIEKYIVEEGLESTYYKDQEENITNVVSGLSCLNNYVMNLSTHIHDCIDGPLYDGFVNDATESLSRIKMENYSTDNTMDIKVNSTVYYGSGEAQIVSTLKSELTIDDFLA